MSVADSSSPDPDDGAQASQGGPDPVDIYVGNRLRMRRTLLGLSQDALGKAIGLTFQQVQKYERGANRMGASRLYDLSLVLDVPVSFFFDEMPPDVRKPSMSSPDFEPASDEKHPLHRRETLELMRAYYAIGNARIRKRLYELIKTVGQREQLGPSD